MPQPSVTEISLKITYRNFCSNLPGANEFKYGVYRQVACVLVWTYHIEAEPKWPTHFRRHSQMQILEWKCLNFEYNLTEVCSQGFNWQCCSIGSDNDLAPTRRQANYHFLQFTCMHLYSMEYWHIPVITNPKSLNFMHITHFLYTLPIHVAVFGPPDIKKVTHRPQGQGVGCHLWV